MKKLFFSILMLVSVLSFSVNIVFVNSIQSDEMRLIASFNDYEPISMSYENGLWKYTVNLPEGRYLYRYSYGNDTVLDPRNPEIAEFENQVYSLRIVSDISKNILGDGKTNSLKFENTRKYINPVSPGEIYVSIEVDPTDAFDVEIVSNSSEMEKEKIPMKNTVIYRFHLKCDFRILKYRFRISDGIFIDYGYGENNDFFEFDFDNPPIGYLNIPEWAKGGIVYQIFPERFKNGDESNDKTDKQSWYGDEKNQYTLGELSNGFFGGDLRGIIESLDYLKDFNIGSIYMNPIFQAPSTHKYDTTDYLRIDDSFGDEEIFSELVEKSHEKGINIILDGVFNHSGTGFFAMEQNFIFQEKSKYLNWYHILKYPIEEVNGSYLNWSGYASLPKFNHDSEEVRGYIASVTGKWFSKGIDGWRLDTVDQFTYSFLSGFLYPVIKSISKDSIVVGEYWKNANIYFDNTCMNSVMNYLFRDAAISFSKGGNAGNFINSVNEYLKEYPPQITDGIWNMLGSHDTERISTILNENTDAIKTAVALQMTFKGSPVIYYGDEIGMTGADDPECRKPYFWKEEMQNHEIREFYKILSKIRADNTCLKTGKLEFIPSKASVLIFKRYDENGEIKVVINSRNRTVKLDYDLIGDAIYTDLITGNPVDTLYEVTGRQILILKSSDGEI